MKNKVLICVDMQNDFVYGALGSYEARAIVSNVVDKVKIWDDEVIFTMDTHDENYLNTLEGKKLPIKHCIGGTDGWFIIDELGQYVTRFGTRIIDKKTFGYDGWDSYLGINKCNYDEIHLVGLDLDICVITNALIIKTLYPDAEVFVDVSCCAGSTPENYRSAINVMKSCQINVIGEDNV